MRPIHQRSTSMMSASWYSSELDQVRLIIVIVITFDGKAPFTPLIPPPLFAHLSAATPFSFCLSYASLRPFTRCRPEIFIISTPLTDCSFLHLMYLCPSKMSISWKLSSKPLGLFLCLKRLISESTLDSVC